MNYFEFYELPISFYTDENLLKKKYLLLSKKYHPDFYINETDDKQREILELSTFNTKAFQTLSKFGSRLKYILEISQIDLEKDSKLPQSFLAEMMDINETLMELEFEKDVEKKQLVLDSIEKFENDLELSAKNDLENFEKTSESERIKSLEVIKNYYLKRKYLLRIKDRLNTFATQ
jgi:molecular chaperone HscB